jgi:hypothetical protein
MKLFGKFAIDGYENHLNGTKLIKVILSHEISNVVNGKKPQVNMENINACNFSISINFQNKVPISPFNFVP